MAQQVWSVQLARQSTLRPRVAAPAFPGRSTPGGLLPYPILRRVSSPRGAARRHAVGRSGRLPRRAGGAASAVGTAGPPAGGAGGERPGWWRQKAVCISYPPRMTGGCPRLTESLRDARTPARTLCAASLAIPRHPGVLRHPEGEGVTE